jgi:hypothetical protein
MFSTYKNVAKGIGQDYSFLHKFFRNLLMGENNELKNRYMLVNAPEEWIPPQVLNKYPTSTPQVQNKLHTEDLNIQKLILKEIRVNAMCPCSL